MSMPGKGREMIVLKGECPSEEAERLLQQLLASPLASVDLRACRGLHTAVIQVLLAAQPTLLLPPETDPIGRCLREQLSVAITR